MATATSRCSGVHTKLRDLSEDGSAAQVDPGIAFRLVDTKAYAAYCAGHNRTYGHFDGFQIHHCRHRHIYEVRGTLSRK